MYPYTTFYLLPSFWRFFDICQRKSVKGRNWNCFISWKTNKQAEAPLNSRRRVRNQRKKRKRLQRRKGNNEFKLNTNAIIDGLARRLRKELDHGATPASAFPCSEILFKMEDKQRYIDSGIREKSRKLTSTSRFGTQTKVSLNYRHAPALHMHERWTWFCTNGIWKRFLWLLGIGLWESAGTKHRSQVTGHCFTNTESIPNTFKS